MALNLLKRNEHQLISPSSKLRSKMMVHSWHFTACFLFLSVAQTVLQYLVYQCYSRNLFGFGFFQGWSLAQRKNILHWAEPSWYNWSWYNYLWQIQLMQLRWGCLSGFMTTKVQKELMLIWHYPKCQDENVYCILVVKRSATCRRKKLALFLKHQSLKDQFF